MISRSPFPIPRSPAHQLRDDRLLVEGPVFLPDHLVGLVPLPGQQNGIAGPGLAEGGVDFLLIETMFSFEETTAAFEGARSMTDLPIVVSFSYDRGTRSMMGVKPKDVIKRYSEMGATLVGANCGTTLENMEAVVKEYAATLPNFPLWVKPNAGVPRMDIETEQGIYDMSPEDMAVYAKKYVELGARVVGGCCGNTPEHIAAIVKALKN